MAVNVTVPVVAVTPTPKAGARYDRDRPAAPSTSPRPNLLVNRFTFTASVSVITIPPDSSLSTSNVTTLVSIALVEPTPVIASMIKIPGRHVQSYARADLDHAAVRHSASPCRPHRPEPSPCRPNAVNNPSVTSYVASFPASARSG